jgi:hypothetical protein
MPDLKKYAHCLGNDQQGVNKTYIVYNKEYILHHRIGFNNRGGQLNSYDIWLYLAHLNIWQKIGHQSGI